MKILVERICVERHIGCILDHPSVFIGGASKQSLRKAKAIVDYLIENFDIQFKSPE